MTNLSYVGDTPESKVLYVFTFCLTRDFYKWQNEEFGNCFTFNSPMLANATGEEDKVYKTTKYGYKVQLNGEIIV